MYSINEEERNRINIIKFLAIVLVLFKHSYSTTISFAGNIGEMAISQWLITYQICVSNIIARFSVPVFFFFSSVLFFSKERQYRDVIKAKVKTLVIPYLIWNTFWVLVWTVFQSVPVTATYFSGLHTKILELDLIGWLNTYGIGALLPIDYPLWFMRELFLLFLIYPVIKAVVSKMPKVALVIGIVVLFLPNVYSNMFINTALGWFLIGGACVYLDIHLSFLDEVPLWKACLAYAISLAVTIYVALWMYKSFIVVIFIFIEICFSFRVSKAIFDNAMLQRTFLWLSKYTMIIYVFHEMTLSCVKKVFLKFLPNTDLFIFLEYHLIPVLIIGICIVFGRILQKTLPKFYALSTGGR